MNTKRIFFWFGFVVVLSLIVWGLIVAMSKDPMTSRLSAPATVTSADHIRGPVDAPITIVEYADLQCPACATYQPIVDKLLEEASSSVRIVFRHFPLTQHQNALLAARASESASIQGKFWEMVDMIYENQREWENLSDAKASTLFESYALKLGLDMLAYKANLNNPTIKKVIEDNRDEAIKIGVNSTPTFFVNGKAIVNPSNYEAFKALVFKTAKIDTK